MNKFVVGVGSTNPIKIAAVRAAVEEILLFHADSARGGSTFRRESLKVEPPDLSVTGFEVDSGVAAQPMTDDETRRGAINRARAVLDQNPDLDLAFGLEGGVMVDPFDGQMYTTVWIAVVGREETGEVRESIAGGGRILVPSKLAERIQAGCEMGPTMDEMLNTVNSKHKGGLFGVVTSGVVPRQREYQEIAVMAVSLWWTGKTPLHE